MATGHTNLTVSTQRYDVVGDRHVSGDSARRRHPEYSTLESRKVTFERWRDTLPVKPEDLAAAGLFYTGIEDICRCYHCGGTLKDWEKGDNPWQEHFSMNEHCGHLPSKYQQESNSEAINLHGAQIEIDIAVSTSNDDVPTETCKAFGYDLTDIENAKERYERRTGRRDYEAKDLVEIMDQKTDVELDTVSAESLRGIDHQMYAANVDDSPNFTQSQPENVSSNQRMFST